MTSPISHGANALKLENEIIAEPVTNTSSSEMMNEQTANNQEVESIVENNQSMIMSNLFQRSLQLHK